MGAVKRLTFTYEQFPFMEGAIVTLDWCQQEGKMGGGVSFEGVIVVMHPFTFVRMFTEIYGGIAGLDMLKIMMHDHIDNLWRKNAKYY